MVRNGLLALNCVLTNEMTVFVAILFLALTTIPDYGEGKHLHAYVFAKEMNWFKAWEFCKRQNKNLVTIRDGTDHWHQQITAIRCGETCLGKDNHLTHTWTAGADLHQSRQFVWMTSGQPIPLERWDPAHPMDNWGGNERCVEQWDLPQESKSVLNDVPCGASMYVICESRDANGL